MVGPGVKKGVAAMAYGKELPVPPVCTLDVPLLYENVAPPPLDDNVLVLTSHVDGFIATAVPFNRVELEEKFVPLAPGVATNCMVGVLMLF
jgi:hypothetical protein